MIKRKPKPYWEMTTAELAEATKQFDDPRYDPPTQRPTPAERAQLRRWQAQRAARSRLTLSLEKQLIEQTDNYAVTHGLTFADVVTDALRKLMRKKSV